MTRLSTTKCPNCGSGRLRSVETIIVCYGLDIDPEGYWEFDDMGGDVCWDSSENKADLDNEIRLDCKDCGHEWTAQLLEAKDADDKTHSA